MRPGDPAPVGDDLLAPQVFVYDLIYNPPETPLLRLAKARGCEVANGLMMLLYQGMGAFEYWTKQAAPEAIMRRALEGELEKCLNH
jgi:shikimate dehydrogenase